jgi:hypothetical protein
MNAANIAGATLYSQQIIPASLYLKLKDLLSTELGVFADGRPAIAVEAPPMPGIGTGLQVIIGRMPSLTQKSMLFWRVTLIQRDRSLPGIQKLETAIGKMRQQYPLAQDSHMPFQDDTYPMSVFSIAFPVAISGQLSQAQPVRR